jgi:hypothetical protein
MGLKSRFGVYEVQPTYLSEEEVLFGDFFDFDSFVYA